METVASYILEILKITRTGISSGMNQTSDVISSPSTFLLRALEMTAVITQIF
jgi:hypothetical protein